MNKLTIMSLAALILILSLVPYGYLAGFAPNISNTSVESVALPDGFAIEVFAQVPGARSMILSDNGILYVGTRAEKTVHAIDTRTKESYIIDVNLNSPNGVALHNGDLYVAEVSRILKYENIDSNLAAPPEPEVIYDEFPTDGWHGWKYIAFGPDGKLYVPVGAPCNVCNEENPYHTITRMNPDGSEYEVFAEGIRNTVGFDWHPETGELWFTDNGRDWFGDDFPPDELNYAPTQGMHFGFPFCHAGLEDDTFTDRTCEEFTHPVVDLGPHVAALGMEFYTGGMFPQEYTNKIFIAEHGSWNREIPIGYRVTLVDPVAGTYEPFAEGWLQGASAWGRPVDIEIMRDGSLLVSDDKAGLIYRIYKE